MTDEQMDQVERDMNETADTYDEIAGKVLDCTTVMWQADPSQHLLGQLAWNNDAGITPAQAKERLEDYLREVGRNAHKHTPGILTMWLRSTFSVRDELVEWNPCYIRAREAITLTLGAQHCERLMRGLEPSDHQQATAHNSRK